METPVGTIATINMLQFSPRLEYMDTAKLDVTSLVIQDGLTAGGAEEICEGYVCQWQAAITVMPDLLFRLSLPESDLESHSYIESLIQIHDLNGSINGLAGIAAQTLEDQILHQQKYVWFLQYPSEASHAAYSDLSSLALLAFRVPQMDDCEVVSAKATKLDSN